MNQISGNGNQPMIEVRRLNIFLVGAFAIFALFIVRLVFIQTFQREDWIAQAEDNRTLEISLPTPRGTILDRNGIILARNIASYNVAVIPALLPNDDGEIEKILRQLATILALPLHLGSIEDLLIPCGDNLGVSEMVTIGDSFAPFRPVLIKCDIERDLALAIQDNAIDWPGVSIEIEPIRDYPTGELTASILGFLGPIPADSEQELRALGFIPARDKVGYAGVEFWFEEQLRGTPGKEVVEVDVAGQILRNLESPVLPDPGNNLVLTIDTRLQQAADAILKGEVDFWNTFLATYRISSGAAIAMNPRTGEILAMVSFPSYENNRLARFIPLYYYEQLIADATQPLLNNAVGAELPAGSVFKIVTSVGALNEGVVTVDQIVKAPPFITILEKYTANDPGNAREFVDWNDVGFGELSFLDGIANSSNVYFYKLGGGYPPEGIEGLGICRLGTYARALGYGDYSGIELPDEADGLIPDPTWKRINQGENWSTGDTYISAVGQGFIIATPLQVLMSAAIIANDGILMRPTVLREIVDDEGNVIAPFQPDIKWDITQDPIIQNYENPDGIGSCKETGELTTVQPWVIETVQEGMRRVVTIGTLAEDHVLGSLTVPSAGKTGTAEYCDAVQLARNNCNPGNWPTHSWTVAYAPFDNPEIVVVAFMYNGGEGAEVAGPVVRKIIEAYFELKTIDANLVNP